MRTFNELIDDTRKLIDNQYKNKSWKRVCLDIDVVMNELNGFGQTGKSFSQYDSLELSNFGGTLAVLRASLIHGRDEVFKEMLISKQHLKVKEGLAREKAKASLLKSYLGLGIKKAPTSKDVDVESEKFFAEAQLIYSLNHAEYEKLQSYWYSIPDLLFRIETKIKVLEADKSTAKFYKDGDSMLIEDFADTAESKITEEPLNNHQKTSELDYSSAFGVE